MKHIFIIPFYLCIFLCLSGCFSFSFQSKETKNEKHQVDEEAKLYHLVFCWLKDEGNEVHRQKIISATQTFRDIPGVIQAEAGQVVASDRDIVDDSFDIGILIVTKNQADLKKYLEHPIHQKAKKEVLSPLVERVLVYDFEK